MATETEHEPADAELARTAWDLEPLVHGGGEQRTIELLDEAAERARAFASARAGNVAQLDAGGLVAAMRELEQIHDLVGRAASYASLRFSVDTADPERGALMQRVQERATEIETTLLFFELEWAALDDAHVDELLAGDEIGFARHFLRNRRRFRPHLLSEPEERIMSERDVTGASAWGRLFEELTAAVTVELPDEPKPVALDAALSRLQSPDRDVRRTAAERVTAALGPGLRTRAFIFNTLLHDHGVEDRLRSYPHWLAQRNLANEASDESVQALLDAVRARYELPQRWYELKARLLGIDRIADYDRAAAVVDEEETIPWATARELVRDTYASFSGRAGAVVQRFFDERWIDAPLRPGKRGGAFCAYTVPTAHPYVLLNYTSRRRDVLTLAHELGHGLHSALAAPQGAFHFTTPLTTAETASVFGEALVFGRLLEQASSPESRLGLLAESLEGAIATVFRQTAMSHFEALVHNARRDEGELSVDRIGELWEHSQAELFGDSVQITDGYRCWWSYVPHFIASPGYVYAYAYGQLLALSVYRRYLDEGEAFVPRYLEMLSAGGSMSPEDLGRIVGVDLADPGFWDNGLALVDDQLSAAERAAREAGRLDG